MKFLKYLLPAIAFLIVSCTGGDGDNKVMRWTGQTDLSDYSIYAGSANGAKLVPFKNDTVKRTSMQKYMGTVYNSNLYASMMLEFGDEMVYFTDSAYSKRILSTYEFRKDSLFINLSGGKQRFVALGTEDELYRIESIMRYKNKEGRDTVHLFEKGLLNLDIVLDSIGIKNQNDMTNKDDTVMWCNVKYIFKK